MEGKCTNFHQVENCIRIFANGLQAFIALQHVRTGFISLHTLKGQDMSTLVYNMANGKEIRRISVPAHRPRVAIVGLDV